ncbi:MAG TPA: adenylate/guanylate cyclase domain-containing protein [Chthonomonadaceae bacterium]|nr:adenylate/guanylate cyclase domain-containing protein [Chthonomonadaceae bacterium]
MHDPPSGPMTFLFAQIEDSTRLWEQHPDRMRAALASYDTLVKQAVETQNGHIFKTLGDAFYAAFAAAPDALNAALFLQTRLTGENWRQLPLQARVALHTGPAEAREGDYFGLTLHRLNRLLAIGHGGQVLVSGATRDLLARSLPPGAVLEDKGHHRLKDLQRPEQVYQLLAPGLPAEFPPLRSLPEQRHNLPVQLTSFIGREQEMVDVRWLLEAARLLTITAIGGAGKSRLAMQVAAEALDAYPDGVWLVELAPLSDPALLPQTVGAVLGVREEASRAGNAGLAEALAGMRLLLLLDNCEHLLRACAQCAATLLGACPDITLLATSREPLGIAGETLYRLPPLSLPGPDPALTPESLERFESVRLFVERASAVAPAFAVSRHNAPALSQICRRLDGIPLAIELAAARVRSLPVEQIAARLDNRFQLLTGGSRTALPRQQTLHALMDWSYDLLTASEKRLFRSLSVFAGGWTLAAAEAVCADAEIERSQVRGLLASLVNKSLVIAETPEEAGRYGLSETIQQYARERLRESDEPRAVGRRHRDFYLQQLEALAPEPDPLPYRAWCEAERDNLRAALTFSLEEPDSAPEVLRLVIAHWPFWRDIGDYTEGRSWLDAALRKEGESRSPERMIALYAAAYLAMQQSDFAVAESLAADCLALARERGEQAWQEHPLIVLGHVVSDPARAQAFMAERIAILRQTSHQALLSEALADLGHSLMAQGDLTAARPLVEEALSVAMQSQSPSTIEYAKGRLALLARLGNDHEQANALYQEHLARSREQGDMLGMAFSLRDLAVIRMHLGDLAAARAHLMESLTLFGRLGNKLGLIRSLEGMAQLAAARQEAARAVRLFAAAESLREVYRLPLAPVDRPDYGSVPGLRAALGEAAFASARAAGRAMSLEQAVAYAQEE